MTADQHILTALRRIIRATDMHSRQLARSHGLTGPQLLLLRQLESASETGLTVGELAARLALSQPTVTGILTRLERRRFVTRRRSRRDRRCVEVQITPIGRRSLSAAPQVLQERFLARLSALPEADRQALQTALEQVVELLEADELDAAPILVSGSVDAMPLRGVAAPLEKDHDKEATR